MAPSSLTRFALLSVAASVLTIGLKGTAFHLTGSVGLLSDALESLVNLIAALMALAMLSVAARPPDQCHAYGHDKAEYFSSAMEGILIVVAAVSIAWSAIPRFVYPQPLERIELGVAVSIVASGVNYLVARVLLQAGRKYRSVALEADAHHLMTDVWTSCAVLAGIVAVDVTGWQRLDPVIALLVAGNIVWTGVQMLRRSADGLMDRAIPQVEQEAIAAVLAGYAGRNVTFHALRSRQAGARKFVSVHVLVPGEWTVQRGHQLLEEIESAIREAVAGVHVITHLEPLNDPVAWRDIALDRTDAVPPSGYAGHDVETATVERHGSR